MGGRAMNKKVHVKTNDEVVVINGKYRGKRARLFKLARQKAKLLSKA
jgi:ribosomal protein L24